MTEKNIPPRNTFERMIEAIGETDQLLHLLYESIDRAAIVYAKNTFGNNKTKIARFLGISRTTLQKKMEQLDLDGT